MNELDYEDLKQYLLLESGQFMAPLEATLMTDSHIVQIITRELSVYSKYRPVSKELLVSADVTGQVNFQLISTDEKGRDIPIMITNVRVPRGIGDINAAAIVNYSYSPIEREKLVEQPTSNFDYRKPILYLPSSGKYKLSAHYSRFFDHAVVNGSVAGIISDLSLEEDELFMKLVLGKFLQYVGRSRRAFRIDNLPIEYDGDSMVQEGNQIYEDTFTELSENQSKWYEVVVG